MKLTMFERILSWMIGATIEVKAARLDEAQQGEILARFDDTAALAAMSDFGVMSMTQGRAVALEMSKLSPAEVNESGIHDSRPYYAAVSQAVIDAGGANAWKAEQAACEAIHLSPEYIAQEYGEAAGRAARAMQEHHAAR